jgi:enoyl-[acyl-carrier protein] reductase II
MATFMNNDIGHQRLNELWARGRDFLGTEHAILAGAMSWVSERNFVSAMSNAGGFGVIACGSMFPDMLADEIKATVAMTDKPFGVNLITMHPELDDLVQVCQEQGVSHVVLAGGLPAGKTIETIKGFGAKLICFAPAFVMAKKLVRSGVDALVIEGSEAGGHIGPVSTQVLAQEILPNIDAVPIFVAGGIGRGEAITQFLRMGASGCQLGTRFVCAEESIAHPNFKKAFIRANARDAQASVQLDRQFPVIPVRALNNAAAIEFMDVQKDVIVRYQAGEMDQEAAQLEIEQFWVGALRAGVIDGDVDAGSLMAGQSVGMVKKEQPMQEIIDELVDQAAQALND